MNANICIAKEEIPQYTFLVDDILQNDSQARSLRRHNLARAERLGNAFHGKVRIVFHTTSYGPREVSTTVWSSGEDYISLKGGVSVPVRAISSVDFS